jgi:molybdopterin synthase catalytic subunit
VHLTSEPIDVAAFFRDVRPSDGGVCLFVGVVRNESGGRETTGIDYEAYGPMAEREIDAILREVSERWPAARLTVRHRVGSLRVGEASVAVLATAPHRGDAFAACREAIDRIKVSVPIWKKEKYADGGSEWVDPTRHKV